MSKADPTAVHVLPCMLCPAVAGALRLASIPRKHENYVMPELQ